MITLLERAKDHENRCAIVSKDEKFTYKTLLETSHSVGCNLLKGRVDLNEERIGFLIPPSFEYVAVQWGIWAAGGIAVPLCVSHPLPAIEHVVEDAQIDILVVHNDYIELISPLVESHTILLHTLEDVFGRTTGNLPDVAMNRRAQILYTSGTTNKPKGVVTTHKNIQAQIETLVNAWGWEKTDYILNILPLHHVHGIINVLSCAMWSGACCEFHERFQAENVWLAFLSGKLTLFMAVPTIYYKLIAYWESATKEEKEAMSKAASKMRLMVSGSAALPVSVLEKWKEITSQTLLERYGMTEIGMGLSNLYKGERRPGYVGLPLPGVEITLLNSKGQEVGVDETGEIHIKGPSVFKEYWNNPEATRKAFTKDGWFITGDIAVLQNGMYKILGRDSVDIIKSGGYKISALEIEDALRKLKEIEDCAVVGIPDEEWGELIVAFVISKQQDLDFKELTKKLKDSLPAYKIPRKFMAVDSLPRNVLGKVTKNALKSRV